MKYSELQKVVSELNSGGTMPTNIHLITKLVLGKIARLRLKSRVKIGEITIGSLTEFTLDTSSYLNGFFALKPNAENKNKCIYYFQDTTPYFLNQTNATRFEQFTEGGYATLIGKTLKINFPEGTTTPTLIYIPYYSYFLVLDDDGSTEKEKPTKDNDTFLLDSVFEDSIVEGILLYLKRKDMDDSEFFKALREWNKSVQELAFFQ